MLNLNTLKQKNYELIWFDGTKLELRKPSQALLEKLMEISELKDVEVTSILKIVYDILEQTLNNNLQGKKFSREEIEESFDLEIAYTFIEDYIKSIIPKLGE